MKYYHVQKHLRLTPDIDFSRVPIPLKSEHLDDVICDCRACRERQVQLVVLASKERMGLWELRDIKGPMDSLEKM